MRKTLPKREILRGYKAFSRVLETGKTLISPPVRLFISTNPTASDGLKVGFSVSRKVRRAADRNYLRRIMRESYRSRKEILNEISPRSKSGLRVVFLYSGGGRSGSFGRPTFEQVDTAVDALLREIVLRAL